MAISLINFHNITMHICTKNNIISIIKCILSTSLLRVFVSIYNNYYSFSHASIHQRCLLLSTIYEALIEKQISCFFLKKTNYLFLSGHCMKLSTESLTLASLFSGGDGSVVLQRGQDRHLMSLFTWLQIPGLYPLSSSVGIRVSTDAAAWDPMRRSRRGVPIERVLACLLLRPVLCSCGWT